MLNEQLTLSFVIGSMASSDVLPPLNRRVRLHVNVPLAVLGCAVLLAAVYWAVSFERKRRAALAEYWARGCAGFEWRRGFPNATSGEIRAFLDAVALSFGLTGTQALKLVPADQLLVFYRAHYPDPGAPDALEIETLFRELKRRYAIEFSEPLPPEVTFGELFALSQSGAG